MNFLTSSLALTIYLSFSFVFAAPFEGRNIVFSAASMEAVDVAKDIAQKGGNVVDTAVALSLAMGVTSPYFAALGGGGFAMVKMQGNVEVLDFREQAPQQLNETSYVNLDKTSSITGGLAVGVPGMPAGLFELHKKYGKLPWRKLFKGAIQLAENGFQVSGDWHQRTENNKDRFNDFGKKINLDKKGNAIAPGKILKQARLAMALKRLKNKGIEDFYKGDIAKDIVESVNKAGGKLSLKDLEQYTVKWRKPITTNYQGFKMYLMPPPSSGGIVLKTAFDLMEKQEIHKLEAYSDRELHYFAEILARAYRGRTLLGDPDFHENPLDKLLSKDYLTRLNKSIYNGISIKLKPLNEEEYFPKKESTETTHLSVMDKDGNAVSMTITLNGNFGSGVYSNKYGINLNNEMDDFTTKPGEANMFGLIQGSGNKVQAGKRPLSSMSPTIVEKDGETVLAIGSPGGPRIISSVLQVTYRHLINNYDIDEAIQAPRLHHQFLPHILYYEKNKFTPGSLSALKKRKHEIEESWAGRVYAVSRTKDGKLFGAYDQRMPGASNGF